MPENIKTWTMTPRLLLCRSHGLPLQATLDEQALRTTPRYSPQSPWVRVSAGSICGCPSVWFTHRGQSLLNHLAHLVPVLNESRWRSLVPPLARRLIGDHAAPPRESLCVTKGFRAKASRHQDNLGLVQVLMIGGQIIPASKAIGEFDEGIWNGDLLQCGRKSSR